jgi:hypothetical protein
MKAWATHLWDWAYNHERLSIGLVLALILVGVGTPLLISQLPPPSGQECGLIVYEGHHDRGMASIQVIPCFWHAYQQCQPATITVSSQGVDTSGQENLTIEQTDKGCDVYIIAFAHGLGGSSQSTFRCASMTQQGEALRLSRCDNNEPPFDIQPADFNANTPTGVLPPAWAKRG